MSSMLSLSKILSHSKKRLRKTPSQIHGQKKRILQTKPIKQILGVKKMTLFKKHPRLQLRYQRRSSQYNHHRLTLKRKPLKNFLLLQFLMLPLRPSQEHLLKRLQRNLKSSKQNLSNNKKHQRPNLSLKSSLLHCKNQTLLQCLHKLMMNLLRKSLASLQVQMMIAMKRISSHNLKLHQSNCQILPSFKMSNQSHSLSLSQPQSSKKKEQILRTP